MRLPVHKVALCFSAISMQVRRESFPQRTGSEAGILSNRSALPRPDRLQTGVSPWNGTCGARVTTGTEDEHESWNRRYARGPQQPAEPDPFLLYAYDEFLSSLFPQQGSALDLAGGTGRHALWLAQRGWRVKLLDISEVALRQAVEAAEQASRLQPLALEIQQADACEVEFGRDRFDLVLVFNYLERKLFPRLADWVRPGGILLYKTYTKEQSKYGKGPSDPAYLLDANELLRAFSSMRVLDYCETVQARGVAELVAQKAQ